MKFRIAIWAAVGVLVVIACDLIFTMVPTPLGSLRTLAHLTCPITLADRHPLSFYLVLIVNAATYALAGTVVEVMRRHVKQTHLIPS